MHTFKNDSVLPTLLEHESQVRFSKTAFTDVENSQGSCHSIRMLKLCDKSIITHLFILFQNCTDTRTFSDTWKKSNIVPVHKKGDKQIVCNYRLVYLLLILGKIFERGFYQLLSVLHEIYKSFDCNLQKDIRLFSQIFQKHLIKCGMTSSSTKFSVLASQETP